MHWNYHLHDFLPRFDEKKEFIPHDTILIREWTWYSLLDKLVSIFIILHDKKSIYVKTAC